MSLVAVITGASRGIGKVVANKLANQGYNIAVVSKSVEKNDKTPGTIYEVAEEISRDNPYIDCIPIKVDVRKEGDIKRGIKAIHKEFGRIDVLFNNASALHFDKTKNTPVKKFDLINHVNTRGSFLMSKHVLPIMEKQKKGHIIMHSPPIRLTMLGENTPYMISKYGMTMLSLGIAQEYYGKGIASNTIWPNTLIKSYATINNGLGDERFWRKPEIIADSISFMVNENPNYFSGCQLIDQFYLRKKGITDFTKYQCVPGCEPPTMDDFFGEN